jgi:lipoprotein signal peptidase
MVARMTSSRALAVRIGSFLAMSVLGGGCDLRTKQWAEDHLSDLPRMSMRVIDPWLELALSYNRGTAFSVVPDLDQARWVFGVFGVLVVIGLFVYVARGKAHWLDAVAAGTIAGGAIGNGFDRLFRAAPGGGTGVVDFIKVSFPWGGSWPTFNVADALVAVGVALLLVSQQLERRRRDPGAARAAPE